MPVTPFVNLSICEDLERPYHHDEAEKNVRKWASSDGSGDKDKIDWKKFRKAFFWYDSEHEQEFQGYKLKFADVINDELQAVWHGVRLAMQVLNGARKGVNIPDKDREDVYKHIVKYYEKFGKEPPALKKNVEKQLDTFEADSYLPTSEDERDLPPTDARMRRTFPCEMRGILDDENRIVEVSFSSEEPVERWYGKEILLHTKDAINFKPIKEVGSILINHDPNQRVAKPLKIWLDEEDKKGRAIIQFGTTQKALEAYQEIKDQTLRGVSVGYQVHKWLKLQEKEQWNGFKGPAYIAQRWSVFEFSLTPVPADASVGVGRTVGQENKKEDKTMAEEKRKEEIKNPEEIQKEIEEARKKGEEAERKRVMEIRSLCKMHNIDDKLMDEMIEQKYTVERAKDLILQKLAERNTPVGRMETGEPVTGKDEKDKFNRAVQDGLLLRVGFVSAEEVKDSGAEDFANRPLVEIARECLIRSNIPCRGLSKMDMVARAFTHTSSDFPLILQNVANKALMQGFEEEPETWREWCGVGSVSDFKENKLVRPGEFDDLDKIPEGAEYKYGTVSEQQEKYSIATYGKLFSITRQTIINDDLNALTGIPKEMGAAARRKIADLAYKVLTTNPTMGDGVALFHSSHGNLAGAGAAPSTDTIKAAIKAMLKQKDIGGKRRLHIRPQFIIVRIEDGMDVEELLGMQYVDFSTTGGKVSAKPNILRKYNLKVISDGRLDDAGTAWYVAGPKGKTVTIFFLDGKQAPTLEQKEGWHVDGVEFKVRIEAGAKAISWKALYKNPGA